VFYSYANIFFIVKYHVRLVPLLLPLWSVDVLTCTIPSVLLCFYIIRISVVNRITSAGLSFLKL